MQFSDYQKESRATAKYPDLDNNFVYPTLGLIGEAGEVADKIKKLQRDQGVFTPSEVTAETKAEITKELGDVLWYVAQLATEFGVDLDEVAQQNIDKLLSRLDRGVIGGSGDNR
ncbi:MAG: NTP pyrophosphatase (non-canonical NTP hydrolase) [Candidatus Paceibacteria bacterium]|jgi:NTP pyrophosphatase (non-canonical NTP hydrolase)